jgi:CTP-dependent riboflavin kinase
MVGADLIRLQELLGFPAVPGTLNVLLSGPVERDRSWQQIEAAAISSAWAATTGQAAYFFIPILIGERYRGIAFQSDEPDYPANQVELISEINLRETLGLNNGDPITFAHSPER